MSVMPRKYDLGRRADSKAETRRQITEAAVELHSTVGPARTTISAIAERAGVQRLTVYRHFPEERELFAACGAHWISENPPPDPTPWAAITDPRERVITALTAIYGWYRANEGMIGNTERDAPELPALAQSPRSQTRAPTSTRSRPCSARPGSVPRSAMRWRSPRGAH